MEGPAIFWIRSIPGPGKQRLSYGKLVRRQPELCDALIWKKNKNAKNNSKLPWQTNKALSTHAMVAQGEGCLRRSQLLRRGGRNPEQWMHCGVLANQTFFLKKVVGNITNNLKSWSPNFSDPKHIQVTQAMPPSQKGVRDWLSNEVRGWAYGTKIDLDLLSTKSNTMISHFTRRGMT